MAATNGRTPAQVRHDIETERDELARALDSLRNGIGDATDVAARVRANLPLVAAAAAGAGFVLAGGLGATIRLLTRRSRRRVSLGRYTLVED
jgi:hypothetical protein